MKITRSSRFFWLLLAFPVFLYGLVSILGGLAYAVAVMGDAHMAARPQRCATPAAARAAGTFLDTVLVTPRTFRHGRYTVVFDTCWVEQRRESRRPAWYAARTLHRLPQAEVQLRYHVEYPGHWGQNPDEWPELTSDYNAGSTYLDSVGTYALHLDLLPDDYYGAPLPIQLSLRNGPCAPDSVRCTVRPAHAYRARP